MSNRPLKLCRYPPCVLQPTDGDCPCHRTVALKARVPSMSGQSASSNLSFLRKTSPPLPSTYGSSVAKSSDFWNATDSSLIVIDKCFEGKFCFHFQCWSNSGEEVGRKIRRLHDLTCLQTVILCSEWEHHSVHVTLETDILQKYLLHESTETSTVLLSQTRAHPLNLT